MRLIATSIASVVLFADVSAAAIPMVGVWADGPVKVILRGDGSCALVFGDVGFRCRYSVSMHSVTIAEVEDRGTLQKLPEPYRFEYGPVDDSLTFNYRNATRRLVREKSLKKTNPSRYWDGESYHAAYQRVRWVDTRLWTGFGQRGARRLAE